MVSVNLIPLQRRIARARGRRVRRWLGATSITTFLLVVVGAAEGVSRTNLVQAQRRHERLRKQLNFTRADLKSVVAEVQSLRRHIRRAEALQSKRSWSGMIGLIAGRLPEGGWLTSLATDPPQPTGSQAKARPARTTGGRDKVDDREAPVIVIEAPRKLRVTGYFVSPADPHTFVTTLKQTNVFSQVVLEELRREELGGGSYFRFQLLCEW